MGYEVHFKGMPAEVMEKYNKARFSFRGTINDEYKLALKVYILNKEKDDEKTNPLSDVKTGVFNIKLFLSGLQAQVKEQEEQYAYDRWKNDDEHLLWYCGWEFSHEESQHNEKDIYDYVVEKLTLLKFCTETGDYFAEDSNFFEKVKEIDEVLDYFEDAMSELKIYEIMHELKEYRIPDDWEGSDDEWIANKEKNTVEGDEDKEKGENTNK